MKVKRIIKGFIYLFPVLALISYMVMLAIPPVRFTQLENVISNHYSPELNAQYRSLFTSRDMYIENYLSPIISNSLINYDDTPIYGSVRTLLNDIGIVDEDNGSFLDFTSFFITYEIYAIMVCAVIDVIFLIPEFYNKIEDKYIKGGKKRE